MLVSAISLFHIATQLVFLFFRRDSFSEPSKSINTMAGEKAYVVLHPCTLEQLKFQGCPRK